MERLQNELFVAGISWPRQRPAWHSRNFFGLSSETASTASQQAIHTIKQLRSLHNYIARSNLIKMVSRFFKCPSVNVRKLIPAQTTALKSIKSLAPLLDRILVQRIKAETKTASGIYLPESSVKELNEARVLAVGPGGLDKEGKRVTPSVTAGDKVLIPQVCHRFRVEFTRNTIADA